MTALGAAIALGAWFSLGPGARPPTAACGETAVASSPSDDPRPTNPPAARWERATIRGTLDDAEQQEIADIVAFRGGFVAIGRSSSGPDSHAFVLRSRDGLEWTRNVGDVNRFAGADMHALLASERRLFALGSVATDDRGGSRGAVWISESALEWRMASGPFDGARPTAIAQGPDGFLLLGTDNATGMPRAWRSDEGTAWAPEPMELPVPTEYAGFIGLVAYEDGWLAPGWISRDADAPAAPVVWTSTDGSRWSCRTLDAGGYAVARPLELVRSGDAWLVVGSGGAPCGIGASCAGFSVAWSSPDGRTWTLVPVQPPIDFGGVAYAGTDDGFVAVGNGTWFSADGVSWQAVSVGETSGAIGGPPQALALDDDGRMAAGGVLSDGVLADRLWLARGDFRPPE